MVAYHLEFIFGDVHKPTFFFRFGEISPFTDAAIQQARFSRKPISSGENFFGSSATDVSLYANSA